MDQYKGKDKLPKFKINPIHLLKHISSFINSALQILLLHFLPLPGRKLPAAELPSTQTALPGS